MSDIRVIRKSDLDSGLSKKYRLYLTGRLQLPQDELQCIDDDIEIGISNYAEFCADKPHMHPIATEHGFVLSGCVRVRMLSGSFDEYEFHEGDFFVIRKGCAYATKNAAGTRVMFIKAPGGNDKTPIEVSDDIRKWLSAWDV